MSYRLVDANKLALKYPEVNDMPCIYADLDNGLDGGHYDLSAQSISLNIIEDIKTDITDIYKDRMMSYNHEQRIEFYWDVMHIIDKHLADMRGET